jgi:hypothetical protein
VEAWERKRELKGVEIRRLGNENAPIIRLGFEKRFFKCHVPIPYFYRRLAVFISVTCRAGQVPAVLTG